MEPSRFARQFCLHVLLGVSVLAQGVIVYGQPTPAGIPGYSSNTQTVSASSSPYHRAFNKIQSPNYDEGSLWGENSRFNTPFDDLPAPEFEVGDIIVVQIKENFRSQEDIKFNNTVESEVSLDVAGLLTEKLDKKLFGSTNGDTDYPKTSVEGTDDYQGKTTGNRRSQLTLDIACTVKKVLPDGRLLIEGRQSRIIGRDHKNRILSGTVDPDDVDPEKHTIDSTMVADSQLRWEGQGPGENIANPGWIHRILDYIPIF